jgi:hypothetical protein
MASPASDKRKAPWPLSIAAPLAGPPAAPPEAAPPAAPDTVLQKIVESGPP